MSWSGTTEGTRKRDKGCEQDTDEVFTSGTHSKSFPRVETEDEYELKAWPRKGGRFRSVVDTVRSLRRDKAPACLSAEENTTAEDDKGTELKSEMQAKQKAPRSARLLRKKFSFLKDRRQRSVSESHLGVMYTSHDDMDPLLRRENEAAAKRSKNGAKKLVRRSSENITGSTTFSRQKNAEKNSYSLPNSPTTFMSGRNYSTRLVGNRSSRSTTSCSSNSRGSSPTHSRDKCPACDFDVLILTECPDCKASQHEENHSHSYHERLIN